jgi:hypothetical protein
VKTYKAPWSTSLIVVSSLCTLLGIGIALNLLWHPGRTSRWTALLPLAVIFAAALFHIRAYTVTDQAILVHRWFWTTVLPLAELRTVEFEPNVMRRSIRMFGNGGMFSFTGWFCNKTLGTYRAFVTDPRKTVVLRFLRRTILVSPSAPDEFVNEIRITSRAHG